MSKVFISYRQTSPEEKGRVRAFAERLNDRGIDVELDQFLLDREPGGPDNRWSKWSVDQAKEPNRVIIIASEAWFQCFDGEQPPGTGLGAAYEAAIVRQRMYDSAGNNKLIRVVLFGYADSEFISIELKGFQTFHAERDFDAIVKWVAGQPVATIAHAGATPKTLVRNNLPRLQPFFGRERELARIRKALDQENTTWGALIDGPGGMGKTSLAIRAAYDCQPGQFERIIFVSIKDRVLDDDRTRSVSGVLTPHFSDMLNEIARELEQPGIAEAPLDQRNRLVLDAIRQSRVLLILDNLESLPESDHDQLLTFVRGLPTGSKAILTSKIRIGSTSEELVLEQVDQRAALATLASLADNNKLLRRAKKAERIALFLQTAGRPLLLRWVAGQLGRHSCRTIEDALDFLRTCPPENDPLEFIFGDLVKDFSREDTYLLCTLTYFTLPARVSHLTGVAKLPQKESEKVLKSLANRTLVVPDQNDDSYRLVPMVAEFLRRAKSEVVAESGSQIEERAYRLIISNGYENYDRFRILDWDWPTIAAALPLFLAGTSARLQIVCDALAYFLDFSGRWDERLSLDLHGEAKAAEAGDNLNAGWRAYRAGRIYCLREQSDEVLACAGRASGYWLKTNAGAEERAASLRLRGEGRELKGDYDGAIDDFQESLRLLRSLGIQKTREAATQCCLARSQSLSGDYAAAGKNYHEALHVARESGNIRTTAWITSSLSLLALDLGDWPNAEHWAREAMPLCESLGRQGLIARAYRCLAKALARQGKPSEGLPYAQKALEITLKIGNTSRIETVRSILAECGG